MGGGTTGVACKKLNRDFIGVEIDEKYRAKLDKIAKKQRLVPRAKTFVLYQTMHPILIYEKALFEM